VYVTFVRDRLGHGVDVGPQGSSEHFCASEAYMVLDWAQTCRGSLRLGVNANTSCKEEAGIEASSGAADDHGHESRGASLELDVL